MKVKADNQLVFVEKLNIQEKETLTCDFGLGSFCLDDQCWNWATWFVEGGFYCDEHKDNAVENWH